MVPVAHGRWLAGHVAGATVRLLPGHGHLSIAVGSIDRIAPNSLRAQAEAGGHAHMSAPTQPPRGLHEDGKGWTVMAVDRASRRWAVAQGTTQSATAVHAYEALHRDNRADARPNDHPATE